MYLDQHIGMCLAHRHSPVGSDQHTIACDCPTDDRPWSFTTVALFYCLNITYISGIVLEVNLPIVNQLK